MSPQQSESRDLDKVIVRLPDGMREVLKSAAAQNNRSMNAEIVARLQDSIEPLSWIPPDLLARVERQAKRDGYTPQFEIVTTLTKAFPAPYNVENAVFEIRNYVKMLERGASVESLALLVDDLHSLTADIADGKIEVGDPRAASEITELLRRYEGDGGAPGWEDNPRAGEDE